MTHVSAPGERRPAKASCDGLISLSIGIEAAGDLKADLDQALAGIS